jgi:hypothetical protein
VYIAAVFKRRRSEKFEKYDSSLEDSGGNKFGGKLFVVEIFFVFSSKDMKDLNVSITFYRTVAVTSSVIWLIIASDKIDN